MPWSLEIHHIDVVGEGDATLIIARHPNPPGADHVRSVLIDGGRYENGGTAVDNYVTGLGLAAVNVIAVTHHDDDHYTGITHLLNNQPAFYANTLIYDPGIESDWGDAARRFYSQRRDRNGNRILSEYEKYRQAIANRLANINQHITRNVNSVYIIRYDQPSGNPPQPVGPAPGFGMPATTIGGGYVRAYNPANFLAPHWLIGQEIMWGAPGAAHHVAPPQPNPPTITCVCANKYVAAAGGGVHFVGGLQVGQGDNFDTHADRENLQDNPKSLGFLVTFGNFRYLIAGDLEQSQEIGFNYGFGAVPGLMHFLAPTNAIRERIHAMKCSHHGSNSSTAQAFINRLRPDAAIISCGTRNKFFNPGDQTINILDGYEPYPPNARTYVTPANAGRNRTPQRVEHPAAPPPAPRQPITHYLTGYQYTGTEDGALESWAGAEGFPAGDPDHQIRGRIRLDVSVDQSQARAEGQLYVGVHAAVLAVMTERNIGPNVAQRQQMAEQVATGAVRAGMVAAVAVALGVAAAVAQLHQYARYSGGLTDGMLAGALPVVGSEGAVAIANNVMRTGPRGTDVTNLATAAQPELARAWGDVPVPPGMAYAIASALVPSGNVQADVTQDIQTNGGSANQAAAAGITVARLGPGTDAAYATAAAMGAVAGGGTVAQAVTLALAYSAHMTGWGIVQTTREVFRAATAAGMDLNTAALAATVAGVLIGGGAATEVRKGVLLSLILAGTLPGNAQTAADQARANAAINPNGLFNITYYAQPLAADAVETHA